jgi:type IV secretory pathway VirB6-like protein
MVIPWRPFVWLLLGVLVILISTNPALADVVTLKANALSCVNGKPSTLNLFGNGSNPVSSNSALDAQLGGCTGNFFARFICLFETTLGLVIATFFCHLAEAWVAPFAAMLMIFMVTMGIMFMTGIIEFTVKEIATMMFKIALIITFAFNTDFALGLAFKFFLGLTTTTVEMFGKIAVAMPSFGDADRKIAGLTGTLPANPNCAFSGVLGVLGISILFIALLFVLPFVFGIFLMAVVEMLVFFARAAFGYLFSLVMLTFLIASMPIFVSMALFKQTREIFDG